MSWSCLPRCCACRPPFPCGAPCSYHYCNSGCITAGGSYLPKRCNLPLGEMSSFKRSSVSIFSLRASFALALPLKTSHDTVSSSQNVSSFCTNQACLRFLVTRVELPLTRRPCRCLERPRLPRARSSCRSSRCACRCRSPPAFVSPSRTPVDRCRCVCLCVYVCMCVNVGMCVRVPV